MAPTTEPDGSPGDPHDPGDPVEAEDVEETTSVLEQMGGVSGLIYSTVPIVVFVPVNALWGLRTAMIAALAVAVAIFVVRLVRREKIAPAISGVLGVAICVFIAQRTGDAKGYFLFGIWTTLVYALVFVASILVRWPIVGVVWNLISGDGMGWRKHRRTLIAYDIATAFWALVFGARYFAQSELYDHDQTGWLAFARIAMGWPLTAIAVLATVMLVRRADREEDSVDGDATRAGDESDRVGVVDNERESDTR